MRKERTNTDTRPRISVNLTFRRKYIVYRTPNRPACIVFIYIHINPQARKDSARVTIYYVVLNRETNNNPFVRLLPRLSKQPRPGKKCTRAQSPFIT